jgi:hypothetical protein
MGRALATCLLAIAFSVSCKRTTCAGDPGVKAEFGIFYGGQVQEREQLPLDVDGTRQTQGFRLRVDPPPERALEVRWEIGMPGVGRRVTDSQGRRARPRRVQLGQTRWRPGEAVFEQRIPFAPGDPLGLWNIRVLVGSQVVLDRPFFVFDERQRARWRARAERDGGP